MEKEARYVFLVDGSFSWCRTVIKATYTKWDTAADVRKGKLRQTFISSTIITIHTLQAKKKNLKERVHVKDEFSIREEDHKPQVVPDLYPATIMLSINSLKKQHY